jgi:hypothetical protein
MSLSREHCAVPQFDVGYTVPPSRPRSNPPPCTAAVKSLPSHCDPRAARDSGWRQPAHCASGSCFNLPRGAVFQWPSTATPPNRRQDCTSLSKE